MSEEATAAGTDFAVDPRHLSRVVLGAVVLALYATWMAADLVARWLLFPVVALLAGYLLYERRSAHDQTVFVGYALSILLVLTPILFVVPDITGGFDAGLSSLVFTVSNLMVLILFGILAAVVAYATYRYDGGRGVLRRIRDAT